MDDPFFLRQNEIMPYETDCNFERENDQLSSNNNITMKQDDMLNSAFTSIGNNNGQNHSIV